MSDASLEGFLAKIDWEGGVDGALDYGLKTEGYTLPPEIKAAWDELVTYHAVYNGQRKTALGVIRDAMEPYE